MNMRRVLCKAFLIWLAAFLLGTLAGPVLFHYDEITDEVELR